MPQRPSAVCCTARAATASARSCAKLKPVARNSDNNNFANAEETSGLNSLDFKMFSAMLKEHQRAQDELKNEINGKRQIAERAVENLTARNVKELNEDVSQAYLNQHKLDAEARKLHANVAKLTKQAQQWMIICNNLNSAVKDLGDISTWTKSIENHVKFIANTISDSHKPLNDAN